MRAELGAAQNVTDFMALAIANRYASALADALDQPGAEPSLEEALEQIRAVNEILGASADLRNVLASPSVSVKAKQALIAKIGEQVGLSKPVRNLLFVMMDNRRIGILGEVGTAYAQLLDAKRGVERIQVSSALEMTAEQRRELVEKFSRISGKTIEAEFSVDEALLGGALVRVGGTVYDGSLLSQLRVLDRAMAGGA